jgi:predicted Zn-dependent peptidase
MLAFSKESCVTQQIYSHRFPNGLTLLAEAMPWLESAAFALSFPAGCAYDPANFGGLASFTCEMVQRGCGTRSSRQFVEDLENLGFEGSGGVSLAHSSYGGAMPAVNLEKVLNIYADLVQRPHLPEDQFEDARAVGLQEVRALEDDLAQKMMQQLKQQHYADPWGRAHQGSEASLEAITPTHVREFWEGRYQSSGAILSVAGKIEWPSLVEQVAAAFGNWQAKPMPQLHEASRKRGYEHISHDASETHIGLAYDSIPYSHADYFLLRAAIGVLSDGMSSRLFTEVREKRGLVYTVYASCQSLLDRGSIFAYAGTTTEKAQETLNVIQAELLKLPQGVLDSELVRIKAHLKTSLIMQQESSRARASSMAGDWYHLQRVRPLEELQSILNGLNAEKINRYLASNAPTQFTICTLGEKSLEACCEIS